MPVDQHQILDLDTGQRTAMERVKSIGLPERNSDWIAIHKLKPVDPKKVQEKPSDINESYEITEEGEHILTLTIAHGQKTWQKSITFNCIKPIKTKVLKNNTDWKIDFKDLSPEDPPLIMDKNTYIINTRNPDWEIIVRTMWLGIKNE